MWSCIGHVVITEQGLSLSPRKRCGIAPQDDRVQCEASVCRVIIWNPLRGDDVGAHCWAKEIKSIGKFPEKKPEVKIREKRNFEANKSWFFDFWNYVCPALFISAILIDNACHIICSIRRRNFWAIARLDWCHFWSENLKNVLFWVKIMIFWLFKLLLLCIIFFGKSNWRVISPHLQQS